MKKQYKTAYLWKSQTGTALNIFILQVFEYEDGTFQGEIWEVWEQNSDPDRNYESADQIPVNVRRDGYHYFLYHSKELVSVSHAAKVREFCFLSRFILAYYT
jgi:hypothetical protein